MTQTKRKKEMGLINVSLDNIFGSGAPRERAPRFRSGTKIVTPKNSKCDSDSRSGKGRVSR